MIQWTISQLIVWKVHTAHDREHGYQDSFTLCRDCTTLPWLWRSSCQQKHKVFFLLLLPNKLSTRGLLKRKNMKLDSYTCELYFLQKEEKLKHLFLRYHFTKNCWLQIGVIVPSWLRPKRAVKHIKTALQVPFCNGSHHTHVLEYLDRK
jgi:hypothetical protein